jgi:hypothetical protein
VAVARKSSTNSALFYAIHFIHLTFIGLIERSLLLGEQLGKKAKRFFKHLPSRASRAGWPPMTATPLFRWSASSGNFGNPETMSCMA